MGEEYGAGEGLGAGIKFAHIYSLRISGADARLRFEKTFKCKRALRQKQSFVVKSPKLFEDLHRKKG